MPYHEALRRVTGLGRQGGHVSRRSTGRGKIQSRPGPRDRHAELIDWVFFTIVLGEDVAWIWSDVPSLGSFGLEAPCEWCDDEGVEEGWSVLGPEDGAGCEETEGCSGGEGEGGFVGGGDFRGCHFRASRWVFAG
jgi:hypothetical protein